jgi:23S rRNA pseudouridine1911/1915/1917 synthase
MLKQGKTSVETGRAGRLDLFLAGLMPELSRSQWKALILDGRVTVNGLVCKPNHKLKAEDEVCWAIPDDAPADPQPEEIPLDILYEDEAVLVLNKPAGLVVHPAAGHETGTLVNALLFRDPVFQAVPRAGIVHRLDRGTSGVMAVAKSEAAMKELQRQFKARETEKEYCALVWGHPPPEGRVATQIGRHPVQRQKMAVLKAGGREAVTRYETVEQFDDAALMRIRIETGRTHQIRVHVSPLGNPEPRAALNSDARGGSQSGSGRQFPGIRCCMRAGWASPILTQEKNFHSRRRCPMI